MIVLLLFFSFSLFSREWFERDLRAPRLIGRWYLSVCLSDGNFLEVSDRTYTELKRMILSFFASLMICNEARSMPLGHCIFVCGNVEPYRTLKLIPVDWKFKSK